MKKVNGRPVEGNFDLPERVQEVDILVAMCQMCSLTLLHYAAVMKHIFGLISLALRITERFEAHHTARS